MNTSPDEAKAEYERLLEEAFFGSVSSYLERCDAEHAASASGGAKATADADDDDRLLILRIGIVSNIPIPPDLADRILEGASARAEEILREAIRSAIEEPPVVAAVPEVQSRLRRIGHQLAHWLGIERKGAIR